MTLNFNTRAGHLTLFLAHPTKTRTTKVLKKFCSLKLTFYHTARCPTWTCKHCFDYNIPFPGEHFKYLRIKYMASKHGAEGECINDIDFNTWFIWSTDSEICRIMTNLWYLPTSWYNSPFMYLHTYLGKCFVHFSHENWELCIQAIPRVILMHY